MNPVLSPADVEALARSNGRTMAEVCRRAAIAQSTFHRWKLGTTSPSLAVYQRIVAAANASAAPMAEVG